MAIVAGRLGRTVYRVGSFPRVARVVPPTFGPNGLVGIQASVVPSLSLLLLLAVSQTPFASGAAALLPTLELPAADTSGQDAPGDEWKFDELELRDGSTRRGMVISESTLEIEFAEIVRPPGKPMFAVIRPVALEQVARKVLLTGSDRARLVGRFQQLRNRARIEAGRMEDVNLTSAQIGDRQGWAYAGPWFLLESTADETMVRRCVVRVEQIFRAYRQLLPPRSTQRTGLRLLIFGSTDEYQRQLRESGLDIAGPAWFSKTRNLVAAGGELNAFQRRLQQTQAQNDEVRRQYKDLKSSFPERLASLIQQMKQRGYSAAQIEQEVKFRSAAWQREYDEAMSRLDLAAVQNEAAFAEVAGQMFAQLYHEAFHAYVDNYACPPGQADFPHWLNEGLAQIFEAGQVEADSLRIDAPHRARLAQLQQELRSAPPLPLREILQADEQTLLNPASDRSAQRYYLYAWGLAYYLAFEDNRWRPAVLDAFLTNEEAFGPAARFTRLIDMPLDKFERRWREAMLAMRPL